MTVQGAFVEWVAFSIGFLFQSRISRGARRNGYDDDTAELAALKVRFHLYVRTGWIESELVVDAQSGVEGLSLHGKARTWVKQIGESHFVWALPEPNKTTHNQLHFIADTYR